MGINSPINITSNIANKCSGLCALNFNFQDSACVVNKLGSYSLNMTYDPNSDETKYYKTFKDLPYEVTTIRLVNNSIHRYNGARTAAELLIFFSGIKSNSSKRMIISIPIEEKASSGAETNLNGSIINSIIMAIDSSKTGIRTAESSDNAAAKFSSGSMYNLNNLIPSQQPFYTYIGNNPYEAEDGNLVNFIVFPRDSSIHVPTSAIERLNLITTPFVPPVSGVPQNTATYNSAGANAGELDNDVYIECAPAGSDGVQLYQANDDPDKDKRNAKIDSPAFTNIIESEWFIIGLQIILFGFVAVIIVFIGYRIFRTVSTSDGGSATTATSKSKL